MKHAVALALFFSVQVAAQPPASPPAFEVASIKPSVPGPYGVHGGCHGIDSTYGPSELSPPPLGRCVISDARLSHLVNVAWQLNSMALIRNAPDWAITGDERFNVQAKAADPAKTTEAQLLSMLQALLQERFQMKFHREDREVSGFALVVAKNGPKLKASKSDEARTSFGPSGKPRAGEPIMVDAQKCSLAELAQILTFAGPGPTRDETGLKGEYDIKLNWDDKEGPTLFTALQEQLGLKLETRKVPQSFFIIDSARRPGEN